MKKLFKTFLFVFLVLCSTRVFAEQVNIYYSNWSTDYPSGLPESFIETEVRYKWYYIQDGKIVYENNYYKELSGYTKDETSARNFYRYITNDHLLFNVNNEIVKDTTYCVKNFCYVVNVEEPTMVDTSEKDVQDYDINNPVEVQASVVPYTGDNMLYYVIALVLSLITIGIIFILKKEKRTN